MVRSRILALVAVSALVALLSPAAAIFLVVLALNLVLQGGAGRPYDDRRRVGVEIRQPL